MSNVNAFSLKSVSFQRDGTDVLKDINFELPLGAFATIIGPNGAGKTTFIKIISGLLAPTSGTVEVMGFPALELVKNNISIGYVPQTKEIDIKMPFTCFDVILMGTLDRKNMFKKATKEQKEAVYEAAKLTQIEDLLDNQINALSGGQLQRVLIARALARRSEILVLDEPITGIDISGTHAIHVLLKSLQEMGKTIVYVSHDLGLISHLTDTIACLNVSLFAHGKPKDVLTGENLKKMYGIDMAYLYHDMPYAIVGEHEH